MENGTNENPLTALVRKLNQHSPLTREDENAVRELRARVRNLRPNEDVVVQGAPPTACVVVIDGMVARYHLRADGGRQYLGFHIAGDMPDAQGLLLRTMDHAVCATDSARVALIQNAEMLALFKLRRDLALVFWRETLIDAAMFRAWITNNSSRPPMPRMAHFFCEQYYRALAAGLAKDGRCRLPLTQSQIGEALGLSLVHVSRTLRALRKTQTMDFVRGTLAVLDWKALAEIGEFDPVYLHPHQFQAQ